MLLFEEAFPDVLQKVVLAEEILHVFRQVCASPEWHLDKGVKVACRRLFSTPKAFLISAQGCARYPGAGIPVLMSPRVARHAANPGLISKHLWRRENRTFTVLTKCHSILCGGRFDSILLLVRQRHCAKAVRIDYTEYPADDDKKDRDARGHSVGRRDRGANRRI